uniref:Uncharacterized protein n=1 Tax=Cyprinus carpio TaxID=7962 RepID=A0A8C2B619_CYPCA
VALLIDATLPKTGSGLALWLLESGCRWELLSTHGALVFLVGMQLGMLRQLVTVDLLMALQVAEATEGLVAELAGIRRCHVFARGRGRHPGEPRVIITICNAKHRQN